MTVLAKDFNRPFIFRHDHSTTVYVDFQNGNLPRLMAYTGNSGNCPFVTVIVRGPIQFTSGAEDTLFHRICTTAHNENRRHEMRLVPTVLWPQWFFFSSDAGSSIQIRKRRSASASKVTIFVRALLKWQHHTWKSARHDVLCPNVSNLWQITCRFSPFASLALVF